MDSLLPKRGNRRLILVHHSLPLSLQKIEGGGYWSFHDRNLASLASSVHLLKENNIIDDYIWVGCPVSDQFKPLSGTSNDDSEEDRNKLQKDLEDNSCYPVETINSKLYEDACISFAHKSLKNIFHYEVSEIKFDDNHWKSYKEFNRQFAWKIEQLYQPGDIIWVHGIQLLTLPRLLRIKNPNVFVGFFLHSPFPAVEVFRCLASRKKILQGMLGANLVAFQAYSYSRYFYQSCTRILGTPAGFDGVKYRDEKISNGSERLTKISVFSEGIDPSITCDIISQIETKRRINELKETFKGKKIIISKDQGEATEGTKNKLLAFELFLKRNPSLVKDVVLFLVCEPIQYSINLHNSNSISCKKDKIMSMINETVARINGEYGKVGNIPIQYINRNIDYEEICSLFQVADILLSAPLREGMNLDTHDFVACHEYGDPNDISLKPGILVLSEFDGASRCFGGALLVNPYSVNEISQGIHDAIHLSLDEAIIKHKHNFDYVTSNTSYLWGEAFLYDILSIHEFPEQNHSCQHLDTKSLDKSYRLAEKRLLIFDYDGAFKKILPGSPQPYLPARIANILKKLSKDTKNIIYVVTSRDKDSFENLLEDIPVGLGCENGSFLKSSTGMRPKSEWQNLSEGIDMSWKDLVVPILEHFSERLPGSSLMVNTVTVTFSYENCSSEYSADNAQELLTTLMEVAGKTPIDISNNNKIIEIKPSGTGNSVAMKKVYEENPEIDFILCIGDDKTEQGVFELLDRDNPHHFSVSVGKKKSYAKYFVNNQNQVLTMLELVSNFVNIVSPPPITYINSISLKSSPVVDSGSTPNAPQSASAYSLPI